MNPYVVLGVAADAGDAEVRAAYLAAVKAAPPDADPVRFQAAAAAYEKIKDEPSRCRYELFDTEAPGDAPLAVFLDFARWTVPVRPLGFEAMKEYLRACAKS